MLEFSSSSLSGIILLRKGVIKMKCPRCTVFALAFVLALTPTVMAAENECAPFSENEYGATTMDMEQRYQELMRELQEEGFGKKNDLNYPEHAGYSLDSVELFEIWDTMQLEKVELPQETVSNFLQDGFDTRDRVFAEIKETSEYQSIFSKLNVGSIWKRATQGLPDAQELLQNSFALDFQAGDAEHNKNQEDHAQLQEGNLKLFTESGKTLNQYSQSSFWKMTQQVQTLLTSEGEESIYDLFGK